MATEERHWRDVLEEDLNDLRRTRDELRVQVHLGALEARETWAELEQAWHQLQTRAQRIGEATHEAADDFAEATGLLVDELRHGYERIKRAL